MQSSKLQGPQPQVRLRLCAASVCAVPTACVHCVPSFKFTHLGKYPNYSIIRGFYPFVKGKNHAKRCLFRKPPVWYNRNNKNAQEEQKPRRVCAAHGANKVRIIFSGGKWVRLQERKARLVKSNPCSAYVGKITLRPASWVRLQLCKLCAAQLVKSNPCSAVEFLCRRHRNYARSRVQAPQTRAQRSGKRESKSLILPLELIQRSLV